MGWAGLSPKGCWADLGSTILSASFGLGRTQPRHQGWARTSPTQKIKRGGIIFPLPSSCMQIDICFACRRKWNRKQRESWRGKKSYLARRRRCLAGLAEDVTHGQKLWAAVLLFQIAEREVTALPFSSVFFPLLLPCFLFFKSWPYRCAWGAGLPALPRYQARWPIGVDCMERPPGGLINEGVCILTEHVGRERGRKN
jgi:hypothetical protein